MESPPSALSRRLRALPMRRVGLAAWLWGEAGIGKTHLSRALLREIPCRSVTLTATLSLPELVRALPRPPHLRAWIRAALDNLQAGRAVTLSPADILAALLGQLAPFVLHLEDLHEADTARLETTVQLAAAAARTRGVALLVTSRLPAPQSWPQGGLQLPLERMSAPETAALLKMEAGAELPAEATAWVVARACGNPLFTLEYFRLLARQGFLWNTGDHWRWRAPEQGLLPTTVEAVIEQVFQRADLSGAARRLVASLAMIPPGVDHSHLTAIAELSVQQLAEARGELERLGILTSGDFTHPLYREIARKQVGPGQRRTWARRAVAIFRNAPRQAAALIEEAHLEPAEAVSLLLQAAEVAREAGDETESARLLAQAVPYAHGPTQARLALEAAQRLRESDLLEAVRLAALASRSYSQQDEATWLYAELLAGQGQLHEAESCLEKLSIGEREGRAWWARHLQLRGLARSYAGVLELWRAHPQWQLPFIPQVLAPVAFACVHLDQPDEASRLARIALELPDLDVTTRCTLNNVLGTVYYHRQEFEAAVGAYSRATEEARGAGLFQLEARCLRNRAMALGELGQFGARMADLETSLRLCRAQGQLLQAAWAQVSLADARLDLAHHGQAEELLLEARDFLTRLGPSEHLIECEYRLSILYRQWAPPHGRLLSLKHGRAALDYARQLAMPFKLSWALGYASIAESCYADAGEGQKLAQEALNLATQFELPGARSMALFAQAFALEAAGRLEEALTAFEDTEALLRASGNEDAAQEVGLEADRLGDRPERAAQRLTWFEQAGMLNLVQLTCRYFPALGGLDSRGGVEPGFSPDRVVALPRPRLDVLGEMRFGPAGTSSSVRGRKRRELLACLLEGRLRGHPDLRRTELTAALYPQTDETQATTALKELVHQTRVALGTGVIQTTASGYALGDLESDAEVFLRTGDAALWRGPYLDGETGLPDGLIADTLYGALTQRVQALVTEQPAEAARLGRVLHEADPYDLPALTLTLRALRAAGKYRSLARLYLSARQELLTVGEHLPEDWATFLDHSGRA